MRQAKRLITREFHTHAALTTFFAGCSYLIEINPVRVEMVWLNKRRRDALKERATNGDEEAQAKLERVYEIVPKGRATSRSKVDGRHHGCCEGEERCSR